MKRKYLLLLFIFVLTGLESCRNDNRNYPVNPSATPEAIYLLDFIQEISGSYTLSGIHNYIQTGSRYIEIMHDITGKYPVIWDSDFSFCYVGDHPERLT